MAAANSGLRERSYRPDIDGIRAIAILSVVLYHAGVPRFSGGFTGVDIFFVLSGFLIGGHIFSELQGGSFSYLRFYQRRAKRILPAFFLVLAFILAAMVFLLSPQDTYDLSRSAIAATLSVSNIAFWKTSGYFDPGGELNPFLMSWSLGVEEQFYVVIPLLMVLLARVRRSWVFPSVLLVCGLSFLFACLALRNHPSMAFYLLPARAWELGAGVALAVYELRRRRNSLEASSLRGPGLGLSLSLAGLAALLLPIFVLTGATPFPGAAALPSVLGTAMVLAVPHSWINRRVLSVAPLVYIGRVSYSWYLWHWPLLAFIRILYGSQVPPLTVTLGAVAVAFGAAVLSYYLVEQPFRKSRRAPTSLLLHYAAVGVLFLGVCGVLKQSHGLERRYPHLLSHEAVNQLLGEDPCLAPFGVDAPNLSPACYDRSATQPSVALWGDSHSAALAPGLRAVAARSGYGFVQLSKAACLPLLGAERFAPARPLESQACLRFNEQALSLVNADPHIRTVVLCGFWDNPLRLSEGKAWLTADLAHERDVPSLEGSERIFIQSLTALIQSLRGAGKQVIVFGETPELGSDPVWRIQSAGIPARRTLDRWLGVPDAGDPGFAAPGYLASDALATSLLHETVASISSDSSGSAPNPQLVDLKTNLCRNPSQCAYRDGDRLLFADPHHLTPLGAQYALRGFHLPALSATGL